MGLDDDTVTTEPTLRPYPLRRTRSVTAPEFPGCRPVPLKREDLDAHDARFEYWDGDTETAWVVREPTGIAHEQPSQRLGGLVQVIAGVRGSPIECFGTMDLLLRNDQGERGRIMQADQSVYLHPGRARLPESAAMVIGEHDYPDVVVEVDSTTDVRRGKLQLYEAWGFPEVWVEVPERASPSRPAGRKRGLTIHVLAGGSYRTVDVSRAFPGWTADEIHAAMNEPEPSVATGWILDRVGRVLGARDGTGPDDSPWLRIQRDKTRIKVLEAAMKSILASRGIAGSFLLDPTELTDIPDEAVIDLLLQCTDESDFRARLQRLGLRVSPPGAGA